MYISSSLTTAALALSAFVFVTACSPSPPPAEQPQAEAAALPIIDMHMHAHEPPMIPPGAPSICRPQPCTGDGAATATSDQTLAGTLEQMDRHNIVRAFLSGEVETVEAWRAAAPGRFIGAPFVMEAGQPSAESLAPLFDSGALEGMGEIATQLTGLRPDDPALEAYFALAEAHDAPVLIHTLGIGPQVPGFRSASGNPLFLEPVLVRHPTLRVFVENSGYPFLAEMTAMMNQYPQLYGDLSTITWILPRETFYAYLRGLMDAGLGSRLMFGSDQMRWPEKISDAIAAIQEAPFLSEDQKRAILHDNAVRFLGLDEAAGVRR